MPRPIRSASALVSGFHNKTQVKAPQVKAPEDIRRNALTASDEKQEYLNQLIRLRTDKQKKEVKGYRRELKSAAKRIAQLDTTIAKLFESSVLGRIS